MSRMKAFVVDDDPIALATAQAALENADFEVITRSESVGTSAVILREKPDVVLLDVGMPSLRGDELVLTIRDHASIAGTVIVLYSAEDEAELAQRARRCGADGYLPKGLGSAETVRRLERFIENKSPSQSSTRLRGGSRTLGSTLGSTLFVDDDELIIRAIRRLMPDADFALSGKEALSRMMSDNPPELVICDVRMPHISGLDVFQIAVAANARWRSRVLLMSAAPFDAPELAQAVSSGAILVRKPSDLSSLVKQVRDRAQLMAL